MNKKELLKGLEKENFVEINNEIITINELLKCKISKKTLAIEAYLHKIYGDEIFKKSNSDEISGVSNVAKLADSEILEDKEFRKICDDIDNSEFDKNLDIILK